MKVEFKNKDGLNVVGMLEEPNPQSKKIVIFVHGFMSNKEGGATERASFLKEQDINSLRIDLDDRGESELSHEKASVSNYMMSVDAAIDFVKEKGYETVILAGASFGGLVVQALCLHRKDINALILIGPVAYYNELLEERHSQEELNEWKAQGYMPYPLREGGEAKILYECIEDAGNFNMYELAKLINIPTLIIHGMEDNIIPYEKSEKLHESYPKAKFVLIEGAQHNCGIEKDFSVHLKAIKEFVEDL